MRRIGDKFSAYKFTYANEILSAKEMELSAGELVLIFASFHFTRSVVEWFKCFSLKQLTQV